MHGYHIFREPSVIAVSYTHLDVYKRQIYRLQYDDCDKFYIGQTERRFIDRYKEHLPKKDITSAKSNFALHLINENHNYTAVSYTHLDVYKRQVIVVFVY